MASTSVAQFAGQLNVQPAVLLEQLKAAGVNKKLATDTLTEQDMTKLRDYLRKSHGSAAESKTKITLVRKQTSEIKKSDATGKSRTIQVEVRKKRVFVKREAGEGAPAAEAAPAPVEVVAPPPVDTHEQEVRDQEQRRQEELAAIQAA
jgi:translation initiation factor IF-2